MDRGFCRLPQGGGAIPQTSSDFIGSKAATGSPVDGRAVARMRGACRVQLGAGAEARVDEPPVLQPRERMLIALDAVSLEEGPFVPIESQPGKIVDQQVGPGARLRARVQILDAQDHAAAGRADREPCDQGCVEVSQVHAARGGRSEAAAHGGGRAAVLGDVIYPHVAIDGDRAVVTLTDHEGATFAVVELR